MWDFAQVRSQAITQLSATIQSKTPLERVSLAKEYKVPKWLFDAYFALVKQDAPLGQQEVDALGLDAAFRIVQIRKVSWRNANVYEYSTHREFSETKNKIEHDFCNELRDVGYCVSEDEIPQSIPIVPVLTGG